MTARIETCFAGRAKLDDRKRYVPFGQVGMKLLTLCAPLLLRAQKTTPAFWRCIPGVAPRNVYNVQTKMHGSPPEAWAIEWLGVTLTVNQLAH